MRIRQAKKIVGRAELIRHAWVFPHKKGTFHTAYFVYYMRSYRRARKIRTAKALGVTL